MAMSLAMIFCSDWIPKTESVFTCLNRVNLHYSCLNAKELLA